MYIVYKRYLGHYLFRMKTNFRLCFFYSFQQLFNDADILGMGTYGLHLPRDGNDKNGKIRYYFVWSKKLFGV